LPAQLMEALSQPKQSLRVAADFAAVKKVLLGAA